MKEIFEQYGGIIITITAILGVIGIIYIVIGTDASSPVGKAFADLLTNFFSAANTAAHF